MGKAVPRGIKTRAEEVMEKFPEKVSRDFEQNKRFIDSLGLPFQKESRNLIAGYVARKLAAKAGKEAQKAAQGQQQ